jgi:hypothetical protein
MIEENLVGEERGDNEKVKMRGIGNALQGEEVQKNTAEIE